MTRKTTLECTKHGLRFEQFNDWHETEGAAQPRCYLCCHAEAEEMRAELKAVTGQRDTLLAAIDVKLSVPVSKERSLSHD